MSEELSKHNPPNFSQKSRTYRRLSNPIFLNGIRPGLVSVQIPAGHCDARPYVIVIIIIIWLFFYWWEHLGWDDLFFIFFTGILC